MSLSIVTVYLALIVLVARVVWQVVVDRQDGPVLWKFTATHGVHEGDLVAIVVGSVLIGIFLVGIAIEMRKLACRV